MTTDLWYLGLVSLITALMWMPYALDVIFGQGMMVALGNRENLGPMSPWAARAKRAHENAVANLVVFAALVLALHAAGATNTTTASVTIVYFWMRLAHYVVYALGVIGVRTLVWAVAWVCQLVLAWQLLSLSVPG